jgi:hypothetical protein
MLWRCDDRLAFIADDIGGLAGFLSFAGSMSKIILGAWLNIQPAHTRSLTRR